MTFIWKTLAATRGDNRLVYFDVSDFDESVLAPASWDLLRFLTSLWVGANSLSVGIADTRILCQTFLDAYASALTLGTAFGQRNKWKEQLLSASQDCAARVRKDWATYKVAVDDGAFRE